MITQRKFNRLIKILYRYIHKEHQTPLSIFPKEVLAGFKKINIWDMWSDHVINAKTQITSIMEARREIFPKFIIECQKTIIIIGK